MFNEVLVGTQNISDGVVTKSRGGKQGDQIVSGLHGTKYEQTYRGNMYGITGGLTTTTAGGVATFTGLIVGNPVGSGVNVAVHKCQTVQGAALTAETEIGIMYGVNTTTASLATIFNRNPLGPASKCVANAGQTITAMTAFIVFGGSGSGAITVPLLIPALGYDFEGGLIIPPGYAFASYTSRVSTTALMFCFNWEEVPI
jgi:hypothetical protein